MKQYVLNSIRIGKNTIGALWAGSGFNAGQLGEAINDLLASGAIAYNEHPAGYRVYHIANNANGGAA